jgi:HPt (histidine-containing phosphotransfer) domain-containing protein
MQMTPLETDEQKPSTAPRNSERELPVDLAHLSRFTFADQALEKEILGLFLAQLPETLAALTAAVNERDWKIAAHTLKGSSRAVGAWRIARLAEEAEALAASRNLRARGEAIARLEEAAAEARAFIESFC